MRGGINLRNLGGRFGRAGKPASKTTTMFGTSLECREVQPVLVSEAWCCQQRRSSHNVTTCIRAIHSNPHPNNARSPAFPTSNAKPVFRTKGIECLIEFILYFTIGSLESPSCPVPS